MGADWVSGIVALSAALGLCPVALEVLRRRQVVDIPNERSSHTSATPRGGGVAVALATVLGTVVTLPSGWVLGGLLAGASVAGVLGLLEDIHGLTVRVRFTTQVVIGLGASLLLLHGSGVAAWTAVALVALGTVWVAAFVNAFNFMDGINGISAVETILGGGAYAWLGRGHSDILVCGGLAVAGAGLGFLPFNVPVARMFLGDSGSYFLGAWLAMLAAVAVRDGLSPVASIAPLALYIADTGITLATRVLRGEPWREPHHGHLYQRLVQAGWTHAAVAGLVGAIVAICCALGLTAQGRAGIVQFVASALIAAVLSAYFAIAYWTGQASGGVLDA